jgi:hypothetical protein
MNLRLAVSVVFVGSLAYACGPTTRTDASRDISFSQQGIALASMGGTSAHEKNAVEKKLKSNTASLSASFDVAQNGGDVRFELTVRNTTAKAVELNFPNGQAYDFVVVDSIGREVWRWADGRIFTQSFQNKLLGKGETMSVTEKWTPLKPGKYTAIAQLRSTNYPIEQKAAFERK